MKPMSLCCCVTLKNEATKTEKWVTNTKKSKKTKRGMLVSLNLVPASFNLAEMASIFRYVQQSLVGTRERYLERYILWGSYVPNHLLISRIPAILASTIQY